MKEPCGIYRANIDNQLGASKEITRDHSFPVFGSLGIIKPGGDSQASDWMTLNLSVDIRSSDINAVEDGHLEALAVIRWGNGSVQHFAELDWRTGTQVRLAGSYVDVGVRVEDNNELSWERATFVASVAPGVGGVQPVTRSFGRITMVPAAVQVFAIPPFTSRLVFFPLVGSLGGLEVRQLGADTAASRVYSLNDASDYAPQFSFPVHGFARFFSVTNTNQANTTFSLMAELSL